MTYNLNFLSFLDYEIRTDDKNQPEQGLKLHLDYSGTMGGSLDYAHPESAWASAYSTVAAGAALVAGLGVLAFLRRSGN